MATRELKKELNRNAKSVVGSNETVADRMERLAAAGQLTSRNADLHWLYEQSVQNVEFEASFIERVFRKEYGRKPTFLREDFCGTALLCSEWVRHRPANTALGVDYDGPTLDWGRANNIEPLGKRASAVTLVQDDVRAVTDQPADIVAAMNFSWWGFKTRAELAEYFRTAHANLRDEGILVLDCYGGPEAQVPQIEEREQNGFDYQWDQDHFNPITGEVRCLIHFGFPDGSKWKKAFRYDWRLWMLPDTCDLLEECGFRKAVVYWEGTDKDGDPSGVFRPSKKGDLAPAWVAYILAFR
jgi:SAM-dependent methyltransferase